MVSYEQARLLVIPNCAFASVSAESNAFTPSTQLRGHAVAHTPGIAIAADHALNGLFCAPAPCPDGGCNALTRSCIVAAWMVTGSEQGSSFDVQTTASR